MVVYKPSVKHLHRNVAALLLEMVLDWKFLWQLSCFAHGLKISFSCIRMIMSNLVLVDL